MHAQNVHSPPKRSRSTTATRSPPSAIAPAQCSPGAPPPNTITSKLVPSVPFIPRRTRLSVFAAQRPAARGRIRCGAVQALAEQDAPSAVVFDLDGVLIESEGIWDSARRRLVSETGGTWRDEATRAMLGMSAPEWSRYVHEQLGVPLPPEVIDRRVVERGLEGYRSSLPLLPGALAAVRALASVWPLGLASSSNRVVIDEVLRLAGLTEDFAVTVSGEEVARGKPAPDVYEAAIEELGVAPRRAVAIEDSSNGLRAAAGAGLRVIAVPNREFPPDAGALALADLVLGSLEQLTPARVRSLLG